MLAVPFEYQKRHQQQGLVPSFGYAPNLLEQDFTAKRPNEKWIVDLSYIATIRGWIYLAVVMDLYSRRIVGWCMSDRMKQSLVLQALKMAIALRRPEPGLIHHSDRGSQYVATFLKAQIVFWLMRATDGHAKNFSIFLKPGARFRMTPLYDVMSTQPALDAH